MAFGPNRHDLSITFPAAKSELRPAVSDSHTSHQSSEQHAPTKSHLKELTERERQLEGLTPIERWLQEAQSSLFGRMLHGTSMPTGRRGGSRGRVRSRGNLPFTSQTGDMSTGGNLLLISRRGATVYVLTRALGKVFTLLLRYVKGKPKPGYKQLKRAVLSIQISVTLTKTC